MITQHLLGFRGVVVGRADPINPLRPKSDLNQISHCNIKGLSVRENGEHDHPTASVRNVWKQEKRICNLIVGFKGLTCARSGLNQWPLLRKWLSSDRVSLDQTAISFGAPIPLPFNFHHHTANSPFLLPHITHDRDGENLLIFQRNSYRVIISFIPMTSLTENAFIIKREI